jgi:hypothetical protein
MSLQAVIDELRRREMIRPVNRFEVRHLLKKAESLKKEINYLERSNSPGWRDAIDRRQPEVKLPYRLPKTKSQKYYRIVCVLEAWEPHFGHFEYRRPRTVSERVLFSTVLPANEPVEKLRRLLERVYGSHIREGQYDVAYVNMTNQHSVCVHLRDHNEEYEDLDAIGRVALQQRRIGRDDVGNEILEFRMGVLLPTRHRM